MLSFYSNKWYRWLAILLCICIIAQFCALPTEANDRSASIIGSSPMLVPGLITSEGLSGQGQIVALADSGLDKGSMNDVHPDLQSEPGKLPKVVMLKSYTDREQADDPNGHGTFMAATIAGSGQASQGKYQGIAPGASLYIQALLDKNNTLKAPDKLNDLFWPAYAAGIRIHVNGWGSGSNLYGAASTAIDKFVYEHPDFLPVFGAGNSGPNNGTLSAQGNSKNALVVGASQVPRPAFDPESQNAEQISASSSRGPAGDGRIKPDLLVPGSALISACSSLAKSNFAANPAYTRMGGSSMAAAVTGGALALLREQLQAQYHLDNPSAALMRALLINGARSQPASGVQQGFGILDIAGTALALKEETYDFQDVKTALKEGEVREYKLRVEDTAMPVKVTLVWTDPPGQTGNGPSLVNNLDLIVQDPVGKTYYGNSTGVGGQTDQRNNVEQVVFNVPASGEYSIKVRAGKIEQGEGQDYAIVYGQNLQNQVIAKVENRLITFLDGRHLNLGIMNVIQVRDGKLINSAADVPVGSEIYFTSGTAYTFGQTWQTGGIQALTTAGGDLLLEMNAQVREGGYYLDTQAAKVGAVITVNGRPVNGVKDIPTGSALNAIVNPVLQTLWQLQASNQEVDGYILEVNATDRNIRLATDSKTYPLAPWAAIAYQDKILDCSLQDTPFRSVEPGEIEKVLPGTKVIMQVEPQTGIVQALSLERQMLIGLITRVNIEAGTITLDSGNSYQLFPGIEIYRDKAPAGIRDLKPGDRLVAQSLSDGTAVINVQAFSNVSYGRVIYASSNMQSLYMIDSDNHSRNYSFNEQTQIYGGGIKLEASALVPGSWIRVIGDPASAEAWWIDLADISESSTKILAAVDTVSKDLFMEDGSQYKYSSATRISKRGFNILAEDLTPGDNVMITTLLTQPPWSSLLAAVEVKAPPSDLKDPVVKITAYALNGILILQGYTGADRLYLYRQDGSTVRVETGVRFSFIYKLLDNETQLRVVGLNTKTGGMTVTDVKINAFPAAKTTIKFNDIAGHWAEQYIVDLAAHDLLKGYGDGGFHPDETLSRAELIAILVRWQNLRASDTHGTMDFVDYEDIPWWAIESIMAAEQAGLISGYPDGTVRPNQAVTRYELELFVARLEETEAIQLFPGERQPNRPVTRAEVAAILDNL